MPFLRQLRLKTISSHRYAPRSILISTPFQRGAGCGLRAANRFNGLPHIGKPLKRFPSRWPPPHPVETGC
jgi:hypothetical protein